MHKHLNEHVLNDIILNMRYKSLRNSIAVCRRPTYMLQVKLSYLRASTSQLSLPFLQGR